MNRLLDQHLERLILAYTPRELRRLWSGLFLLVDTLGEQAARRASEPILIQMRLAWWRDSLESGALNSDPALIGVAHWPGDRAELVALVDAFEAAALDHEGVADALAEALCQASQTITGRLRDSTIRRFARSWALLLLGRADEGTFAGQFSDARVDRSYHPLRQLNQAAALTALGRELSPGLIIRLGIKQLLGH